MPRYRQRQKKKRGEKGKITKRRLNRRAKPPRDLLRCHLTGTQHRWENRGCCKGAAGCGGGEKRQEKRKKIRKTNYKIVNHVPAFPRSGEGRGAPSLGTFEGWGGVQARRRGAARLVAKLRSRCQHPLASAKTIPASGKGRGTRGGARSASHSTGNLEGKRRNDRGRRQRLFPKQLRGLWQSLAVGSSSRGPARRFPR